jgi:hypothetical protein
MHLGSSLHHDIKHVPAAYKAIMFTHCMRLNLTTQAEQREAVLKVLRSATESISTDSSVASMGSSSSSSGTSCSSSSSSAVSNSAASAVTTLPPLSTKSEQPSFGNWQSAGDQQRRRAVTQQILNSLAVCISSGDKNLSPACRAVLPQLVQSIEQALYLTSDSLAEYKQSGRGQVLHRTVEQFYCALLSKVNTEQSITAAVNKPQLPSVSGSRGEIRADLHKDSYASSDVRSSEQWLVSDTFTGHLVRFGANGQIWYGRIATRKPGPKKSDNQWLAQYRDGHELRHCVLTDEQKNSAIKAANIGYLLFKERVVAEARHSSAHAATVATTATTATAASATAAATAASAAGSSNTARTAHLKASGKQQSSANAWDEASVEQDVVAGKHNVAVGKSDLQHKAG